MVRPRVDSDRLPGPGGTIRLGSDSERESAFQGPRGAGSAPGNAASGGPRGVQSSPGYPSLEATHRDSSPADARQGGDTRPALAGARRGEAFGDPRRVGPYEILGELGRGGMGAVYRARHVQTGLVCALKTLHQGGDEEDLQRFRREADLAWQLDHPGIVKVLDVGSDGPVRYLVLELLEGGSLQARLARQGPLPIVDAIRVGVLLADALSHAHAKGVLHRDLKPANVIFDERGEPKLADFGLAQGPTGHSLTVTGSILGTPAYMAPEQARDSKRVDQRTDVYGLGALLYGVISGRPPVVAASLHEALLMLEEGSVPPLRSLRPDASPELEGVFKRVLAREPADRYPTAAAFSAALSALAADPGAPLGRQVPWVGLVGAVVGLVVLVGLAFLASRALEGEGPSDHASASPTSPAPPPESPSPTSSSTPAPNPSAPPAAPIRSQRVATVQLMSSLREAGPTWEGVLTWSSTSNQRRRVLSAFVRQTRISSSPWLAQVDLLRVKVCEFPTSGRETVFDSNFKAKHGFLPLLLTPRPWGKLQARVGEGLLWTPSGLALNDSSAELASWVRDRLLAHSYAEHWLEASRLSPGDWGERSRKSESRGLRWAAWIGEDGLVTLRGTRTHRIKQGVYLGKTHKETWPALASFNDFISSERYAAGYLVEEPPSDAPTGGNRVTLQAGSWIQDAPFGWPRARLTRPRAVFLLDLAGEWRRIQWGSSLAYVSEGSLGPGGESEDEGWEVRSDTRTKGAFHYASALSPVRGKPGSKINGVMKGQRFVPTGGRRGTQVEVFYQERTAWIEEKILNRVLTER